MLRYEITSGKLLGREIGEIRIARFELEAVEGNLVCFGGAKRAGNALERGAGWRVAGLKRFNRLVEGHHGFRECY